MTRAKVVLLLLIPWIGAALGPMSAFGQTTSSNLCDDREARTMVRDTRQFLPLSSLPLQAKAGEVIVIGEIHYSFPGRRKQIIESLASTLGKDGCLFYELSAAKNIEQHLLRFKSPGYENVSVEFNELHGAAQAAGLREFTVDTARAADYDLDDLNPRDEAMATRIEDLFNKKTCSRGLFFVGKDHVLKTESARRPFVQLLRERGRRVITFNLQSANDDGADPALASWNGVCSRRADLPRPTAPVLFRSSRLPPRLKLSPLNPGDQSRWTDFDWTILL